MSTKQTYDRRMTAVVIAMATIALALLGSASLDGLPLVLQLVGPFALGTLVYILFEAVLRSNTDREESPIAKLLTVLIMIALALSTYTVIQSLWIGTFDSLLNKFAYENIAVGASLTAAIFTLLLSTMQRDIYWVNKKGKLDERQVRDRHQIFETSYKISGSLSLMTAMAYAQTADSVPRIIELSGPFSTMSGHYVLPVYNLLIAFFAVPLIVASLKKR